jgi:hypothetical protein
LRTQDGRVTLNLEEENLVSKLEVLYIPRCHQREGYDIFEVQGESTPRFINPFKIMEERGEKLKEEFLNFFSDPSESQG